VTKINFLFSLDQLCRSEPHYRFRQQYLSSPQSDTQPSSVSVNLVTMLPILVLLAGGNLIGLFFLLNEPFFYGDIQFLAT
jgi:hypothetical protein